MSIQVGTVDGLINIGEQPIKCFVEAIDVFSVEGISFAKANSISFGTAFQRFVEPVYTNVYSTFNVNSILRPALTVSGNEQSPARVTYCKKMGLLEIDESNDIFRLTPLGKLVKNNDISVSEYAFILLSKMGIFVNGKLVDNLFCSLARYFKEHATISDEDYKSYVISKYNDSSFSKTRFDIIVGALCASGLTTKVGKNLYVLSSIIDARIFDETLKYESQLKTAFLDNDLNYAEFVGNLKSGIFSVLNKQNIAVYTSKFKNLNKYITNNFSPYHDETNLNTYCRIYRPYITAIKSKPFLLLAGISGTGKSRIVRELARACWDEGSEEYKAHKPKNFEMVQVKPNWHDSSELIGYVSRIDGEKFVVGPFLKFMVKAINDPEHPYFLCLDEMNLAPVEQYFAEYLSVVESRKVNEEGKVVTDPIIDYEPTDAYKSLIDQLFSHDDSNRNLYLTSDKTADGDPTKKKRLTIPQNLIVIGTVNMDETTFSFSRKVLDRAMTIEMNEVDLNGGLTNRYEKIGKLGNAELVGTAVEGVDVYSAHKGVCDKVIAYLKAVNDKLEGTPFKIAYRTRNEFLLYVVNNLPYNKDEEGKDLDQNFVIARALDEITNMKILSRIEGDETKVNKLFNNEVLKSTIKTALTNVCAEYDTETSISLAKLKEMKDKLESGYTSFWS